MRPPGFPGLLNYMWHPVTNHGASVPEDRDVRLAVIDSEGTIHALIFPCRRVENEWLNAKTRRHVELSPTHWQDWSDQPLVRGNELP